jgi:ankyrin repeat protein
LVLIIFQGHKEIIEALLDKGADVNSADEASTSAFFITGIRITFESLMGSLTEWTPLISAASAGFAEIVKILIARGAKINAVTENRRYFYCTGC